MKKIFLTGATGFIGSHLLEKLVVNGYKVKVLAEYNIDNSLGWIDSFKKEIRENVEVVYGNIRDPFIILNNTKNYDVLIHLAALISIPYSYIAPKSFLDTNLYGTLNILNSAKKNNISHTIITSTSEVYGTAQYVPIDESHPINPQSPYAASKSAADNLSKSFVRSYDLPVTILRPFNNYGPRQSARAVIPNIIVQLLNNKKTINLGSVKPVRDFMFIEDTVKAFNNVIFKKKIYSGQEFNIGSNFEISVRDILKMLKNDFNYDFKINIQKNRLRPKNSEVFRLFSSNKKFKKHFNWKASYGSKKGFKIGLEKFINWLNKENNMDLYDPNKYQI